jgi:hypothetical protein
MNNILFKQKMQLHAKRMEVSVAHIQEGKTGFPKVRDGYQMSEISYNVRQNVPLGQPGPSTQLHLQKRGYISKLYFRHWKPPGVSERMWSVNLDASISGEHQTLGGHSCWPSESLGALTTSLGAPGSAGDKPGSAGDKSARTSNHSRAVWEKPLLWERCLCA